MQYFPKNANKNIPPYQHCLVCTFTVLGFVVCSVYLSVIFMCHCLLTAWIVHGVLAKPVIGGTGNCSPINWAKSLNHTEPTWHRQVSSGGILNHVRSIPLCARNLDVWFVWKVCHPLNKCLDLVCVAGHVRPKPRQAPLTNGQAERKSYHAPHLP